VVTASWSSKSGRGIAHSPPSGLRQSDRSNPSIPNRSTRQCQFLGSLSFQADLRMRGRLVALRYRRARAALGCFMLRDERWNTKISQLWTCALRAPALRTATALGRLGLANMVDSGGRIISCSVATFLEFPSRVPRRCAPTPSSIVSAIEAVRFSQLPPSLTVSRSTHPPRCKPTGCPTPSAR
jgi:hypothetical protein